MRRDPGKWLEDIWVEGSDAIEFIEGQSVEAYVDDKRLRAMVERKLFVIGEAVSQLKSQFPEVADRLPETREIVGFRNLLAHGYFALDHRRVYDIAVVSVPVLLGVVKTLLDEFP